MRLKRACIFLAAVSLFAALQPAWAGSAVISLTGAGSTFDAPLFQRLFSVYAQSHPVTVAYQANGSGAGIVQFINNAVDFGASDLPLNGIEQTLATSTGSAAVQIPIALGGVAIAYNEPHILGPHALQLDGPTLSAIFLGKIVTWNDPAIAALNPDLRLPSDHIRPIHRSDSSGTTYIFTDYLSSVSNEWAARVGKGKSVAWPGGFFGKGSPGVSAWLKSHQGSIGYVEVKYVIDQQLPYARVKNRAGAFVVPSLSAVSAAASQFPNVSADRFSIVNAPGGQSYPITSYSWVLLRQKQPDPSRGAALVKLLRWAVTAGQSYAAQLNYAPLPASAQALALKGLDSIVGATG